jgi:tRNA U34 5-methylaminomethyl-2-thiouridine-forming methyltransferase MnmC
VTDQSAELDWTGRVPVSRRFADPYYSLSNGLAEARHVFLAGNGLPARFRSGFAIAELGFGTGLNVLAAWAAWREAGIAGPLAVTSFEAYPLGASAMAAAHAAFPQLAALSAPLVSAWGEGARRLRLDGLVLDVVVGDARETLPAWAGSADAWFLDGFAPARNPELWDPGLLAEVARHTRPGGTAATYSAAGAVRRGLAEAGFAVERRPGHGAKRHMTAARL